MTLIASCPPIRALAASIDPQAAIRRVRSIEEIMADGEIALAVRAKLLGVTSVSACVIAGLGVYAIAAVFARRRRRELAIRMALGASRGRLQSGGILRSLSWAAPGLAVGLALAYWGAASLAPVLFGVDVFDTGIYGAAVIALVGLIVIAGWIGYREIEDQDLARTLGSL